jgi:hypothetical protein
VLTPAAAAAPATLAAAALLGSAGMMLNASMPSQRVDHVVVRRNGRIVGKNGEVITHPKPSKTPEAHIPLGDWLRRRHGWGP